MTHIAVVDNDDTLLLLLTELFAAKAWETLPHRDARTAFAVLKREQPDAILLDLRLNAAVSGWDVLHQLKMDPGTRSIPVIVWSGAIDDLRHKETWLAERSIPTLEKPFEIDDLYETIEAALSHKVQELAYEQREGKPTCGKEKRSRDRVTDGWRPGPP